VARPRATDRATRAVVEALRERGLLLQAGHEYASVADLVAGEPVAGSWWAHPRANLIYWVCQDLEAHPDVSEARLIAGKVTQIWRSSWADVAAVALANESWQWANVGAAARALVARTANGTVRTGEIEWHGAGKLGDACRLLEQRLLVKSEEVHTPSGRHEKLLESWASWWAGHATGPLPDAASARARLEERLGDAARHLPWQRAQRRPRRAAVTRRGARSGRRSG
jgi:hypothetical protein